MKWKRANYLIHRWIGILLGLIVFVWFVSGVVMMYYPYPALTESQKLAMLRPFEPTPDLIGFDRARRVVEDELARSGHPVVEDPENIVGGRLMLWRDRPVYQLWHQRGYRTKAFALIDARTGEKLTPLEPGEAAAVAGERMSAGYRAVAVDLLPRGDHYMFFGGYHLEEFPVYRVRFDDPRATALYLGQETGTVYGVVDRFTRVTSWLGPVPHWLYFMPLLKHPTLWTWTNLILPGVAVLISLTGMVLGAYQLFPHRRRAVWKVSAYRGISKWHHLAGVVFGLLVFTWTLSGVFEMLGASNDPRTGQAWAVRAGPMAWEDVRLSEAEALASLRAATTGVLDPVAIDFVQLLRRPAYHVHLSDGRSFAVDAVDGTTRAELPAEIAIAAASRVVESGTPIVAADLLDRYDTYYYARHGREMKLPAWRVAFDDAPRSTVYLDAVSGMPSGFVDADTRKWRWLRDAMHSLDFPAIVHRRPLWDLIVLPLMLGGVVASFTGVWLLVRRLWFIARRRFVVRG